MAITRQKKAELVAQYKELIANSTAMIFTDYKGTTVGQANSLRAKMKENDTTYVVVKNSLFELALKQSDRPAPAELLLGTNAVAFIGEDIGKSVKALNDWIKSEKIVSVKGAILENSVVDAKAAEGLSDLPSKEQTRAMLLGALSGPARQLAQMVAAPGAGLARVLRAHVDKQQEAA